MRSEINMENSSNRLLVSFAQVPKIKCREDWCKMKLLWFLWKFLIVCDRLLTCTNMVKRV